MSLSHDASGRSTPATTASIAAPADALALDVALLAGATHGDARGEGRARLLDFRFCRTQAGLCTAEVELELPDGRRAIGRGRGAALPTGEIRAAAEATLAALLVGPSPEPVRLELAGVKSLRAFDEAIVIVAVTAERDGAASRLLGCVLAGEDANRAAVLATLSATNRVLSFPSTH